MAAELLLLAVDPAGGGLLRRRRRRFRKALAMAHLADRGGGRGRPWLASRARREAVRELQRDGILERGGPLAPPRLADRTAAIQLFQRLRRCVHDNDLPEPRDHELLVLLAWSGVLAGRLSMAERRLAARRLRKLGVAPQAAIVPLAGAVAAVAVADLWSAGFASPGGGGGDGGGGGGLAGGGGGSCGGDGGGSGC